MAQLREYRKVNGYNQSQRITQNIKIPMPLPRETQIELHIVPHTHRIEMRLWYEDCVRKVIYYKKDGQFKTKIVRFHFLNQSTFIFELTEQIDVSSNMHHVTTSGR
jgi:hypothetical protein